MNFNKTVVATFVGAALSSIALSTAASDFSQPSSQLLKATQQQQLVKADTASGMANQFDAQMGQVTFRWADRQQQNINIGVVAAEHQVSHASEFYLNKLTGLSSAKSGAIKPVLASIHDQGRGALIAKYKQEIGEIEVFNRELNIMMDREFNLVASSGYFASGQNADFAASQLGQNSFGESALAITKAFSAMGGDTSSLRLSEKESNGKYTHFSVENTSADKQVVGEPRAKKVFFEAKGKLVPSYYVEIETSAVDSVDSEYFSYVISSIDGSVLFKNNLVSHSSDFNYRIYADDHGKPWDSPHGNVIPAASDADPDQYIKAPYLDAPMVTLAHGPISTMDPWLADDATETTGNNVNAYVDAIAPDGLSNGDYRAATTGAQTFDYKYDTESGEYSRNNRNAAIVNLFYLNNYLHDDFYDHGFDEMAGNAQALNYGRGGVEGDALRAEVQDNSGTNNANMSTPADGSSPRMQMYLFDKDTLNGVDYAINVTSEGDLALLQSTVTSSLGPTSFEALAGKLVRIDDGFEDAAAGNTTTDGCEAAVNGDALAGNIAVIDRGACAFVDKILNAQAAGAVGVIVANNADATVAFRMGGDDPTGAITIPNMMISQNEGIAIYKAMVEGDVTVSMYNNSSVGSFKGSSWDNGIVAHEWGHYISNRLVGNSSGLINQQGRSMGEGWGDFHALILLAGEEDALMSGNEMFETAYSATSYVANFNTGIRNYAYSTDMNVNPLTFANVTLGNGTRPDQNGNAEVHDAGEPWAVMLWDSFVGLVNDERHTFAEAQSLMKDYLVAGYKMTPIAPTYTEARDAILAAAYAHDVEDYNVILAAFARRGMGLGAVSPSRYSTDHSGVVESDKTELATFTVAQHSLNTNYAGVATGFCSNDNILDKGETGTVSFTVENKGSQALENVMAKVEVVSGHDVTFAHDGMITFDTIDMFSGVTSEALEFTLNDAGTADDLVIKLTFPELSDDIVNATDEYMLSTVVNVDFKDRAVTDFSATDDMETAATLHDFSEHVMAGGDLARGTFGLDSTYNWLFPVGQQYTFASNNGFTSDVAFETRSVTVGFAGDFSVSWWQYYEIEENWDGGVVEVSINGADWTDVTNVGGSFGNVGYTGTIIEQDIQAISGREAFTGYAPWPGGMESVNFGSALNGNDVKFRFRISSDSNTNWFGWIVDNVTFDNIETPIFSDVVAGDTFACDNRLPIITSAAVTEEVEELSSASISIEAVDPNGDELTYSWTQTAGTAVELTGGDSAEVSFTAPGINTETEVLSFTASVSDGMDTVSHSFDVTVLDDPEPVITPRSKAASGSSTGILALLLLPLALLRRRK